MEPLLTPQTLAAALGLAEQTIYNRHSTGGNLPPAIKLGRLLRFRPADVEAWLERQKQPSPSAASTAPVVQPPPVRRRGRPTKAEQIAARRTQ
ncbi:helix-turn-helix transcriptional regulator [Zoogloea sp.]|uniref:helix-turn-helix transcriptional regulator n=1 Tax=Zoogloea sp. TaxID=49181 RepID=UPI0035AEF4BD